MYIYKQPGWPRFTWDIAGLLTLLSDVRHAQGRLVGKMTALGWESSRQANLTILLHDVAASAEIEGTIMDAEQLRTALSGRLGLSIPEPAKADSNVDGAVELIVDATSNFEKPLSVDRLFDWHRALDSGEPPGSAAGIQGGRWRTDAAGPARVVTVSESGEERIFLAPLATRVDREIGAFLSWINSRRNVEPITKAALAHLWFMTIHPFETDNGLIARAMVELLLAQSDGQANRFYSMSPQINREKSEYCDVLDRARKGSLDVTEWMHWFLQCMLQALHHSEEILGDVVQRHLFWVRNAMIVENDRQRSILNMLLDGMQGRLTSSRWAQIAECSQDTALRDIQKLIDGGVLVKLAGGGRSTGYDIVRDDM